MAGRALLALCSLLSCACSGPLARSSAPWSGPQDPAPEAIDPARAAEQLFEGIEGLHAILLEERQGARAGTEPRRSRRRDLERSVRERYADGGFGGAVRHVVALAITGIVPMAPGPLAELILAPDVEQRLLAADQVTEERVLLERPGLRRAVLRLTMSGVGIATWRVDLRVHIAMERWDLADGRVLLRYDPHVPPQPRHVTLWRGACLLEPLPGGGTRATEVLVLATDLRPPPLFAGLLTQHVWSTLENRALNLWIRAHRTPASDR